MMFRRKQRPGKLSTTFPLFFVLSFVYLFHLVLSGINLASRSVQRQGTQISITANHQQTTIHPYIRDESLDKQTTIVLMGYYPQRISNYNQILNTYAQMGGTVDRVLFLWNNLQVPPPAVPRNTQVPIVTLQQSQNSMNNRFGTSVTNHTRTASVLLVDDDVVLSHGMIQQLLKSWQYAGPVPTERPVVGIHNDVRMLGHGDYLFPCNRVEGWFFPQGYCYRSLAVWPSYRKNTMTPRENMVIGKSMLFSTAFLSLYQQDQAMQEFVESGHYCEDVLMNALIRKETGGKSPVLVKQQQKRQPHSGKLPVTREVLKEEGGLSFRDMAAVFGAWTRQRRECVVWSEAHFGDDIWM